MTDELPSDTVMSELDVVLHVESGSVMHVVSVLSHQTAWYDNLNSMYATL